jgi:hypothetical protein
MLDRRDEHAVSIDDEHEVHVIVGQEASRIAGTGGDVEDLRLADHDGADLDPLTRRLDPYFDDHSPCDVSGFAGTSW